MQVCTHMHIHTTDIACTMTQVDQAAAWSITVLHSGTLYINFVEIKLIDSPFCSYCEC
jgi:hypothetical protein